MADNKLVVATRYKLVIILSAIRKEEYNKGKSNKDPVEMQYKIIICRSCHSQALQS